MNKSLSKKDNNKLPLLCNDVIFKSLFTGLEFVLERLIYDITGDKIKNSKLSFNEIPISRSKEKFKRCDFLIKKDDTIYNIELNSCYYDALLIKNTSYIFSLYSTDASRGEEYNDKLKVVQININNFTRFKRPVLDYKIMNESLGNVYLESLKIWDLDIVKCKKMYYNERIRKRRHIKWGALFSCMTIDEIKPIIDELLTKKESDIFMEKLDKITNDNYVMSEAEALRLDDMFRRSIRKEGIAEGKSLGLAEGKNLGIEENQMKIIKNMLNNKFDLKTISKITSKSLKDIMKIKESM